MVLISYKTETRRKIISPDRYDSVIVDIKEKTLKNSDDKVLAVQFYADNSSLNKNFKLWDKDLKVRSRAEKDWNSLCKTLGIKIPLDSQDIDFDTDILLNKEIGIKVSIGKGATGDEYNYIDSFFKTKNDDPAERAFIEDEIPL